MLAGRDARLGRGDHLLQGRPGLLLGAAGRGLEVGGELRAHHLRHDLGGGRGAEHLLGLPLELRLGQPDRDDRDQALEHVLLDDGLVAVLQQPGRPELLVERADHGPLEAGDVLAAVRGGDDVDERADHEVVAAPPLERHVDLHVPLDVGRPHMPAVVEHRDGLGEAARAGQPQHVGDRLARAEVGAVLADAAVEAEHRLLDPFRLGVVAVGRARGRLLADADGQPGH